MKGKDRIRQMALPTLRIHFVLYDLSDPLADRAVVDRSIGVRNTLDLSLEEIAVMETRRSVRALMEADDGT